MTSLEFAQAARTIGIVCRRHGLVTPGFRSPPAGPFMRTIRRRGDHATVAVVMRDRPARFVITDMVDGAIEANGRPDLRDTVLAEVLG